MIDEAGLLALLAMGYLFQLNMFFTLVYMFQTIDFSINVSFSLTKVSL
jgi:hypothetical protein